MTTDWAEYLARYIADAPIEELLLYAEAREALIAKDDNYPEEGTEWPK